MRVGGACGHAQSLSVGLRQGCQLSATLFGIFIDDLYHHLQTTCPDAGVDIRSMRLSDLVYADDICLMASSSAHLQALIDALDVFCDTLHMEVSVAKTKVMVVSAAVSPTVVFLPSSIWACTLTLRATCLILSLLCEPRQQDLGLWCNNGTLSCSVGIQST